MLFHRPTRPPPSPPLAHTGALTGSSLLLIARLHQTFEPLVRSTFAPRASTDRSPGAITSPGLPSVAHVSYRPAHRRSLRELWWGILRRHRERRMAGQEGLEPPALGFGDRCSTN